MDVAPEQTARLEASTYTEPLGVSKQKDVAEIWWRLYISKTWGVSLVEV